jgi:hypothetical protein
VTWRSWLAELTALAAAHGGTVERTRGGHVVVRLPNGATVYTSATPSDRRALLNTRADLRRAATAPRRTR